MCVNNHIPETQRALVLQGGGALGAYEAGVFTKLFDQLYQPDEPLFDIVIGTSIGAINGAILISHVKQKETWEDSPRKLVEFWKHLSTPTPDIANLSKIWLGESARRYYSTKYFSYNGIKNVFSPPKTILDARFFDNLPFFNGVPNVQPNIWHPYSNERLAKSLEHNDKNGDKFIDFPIKTSFFEKEKGPRFLAVSVDVSEAVPVTFDSYEKKDKKEDHSTTTYSRFSAYGKDSEGNPTIRLDYPDGISSNHVMASATVPINFEYQKIGERKFWDGGMLSNTPLRELLQSHRDYWYKQREIERVPDLEVYLINVWPSREKSAPEDYDGIKDRENDITFKDRTKYDRQIGLVITQYIDMINGIKEVTNEAIDSIDESDKADKLKTKLDEIFKRKGASVNRSNQKRSYESLLRGRFRLKKIVTIERKDDPDAISGKWADYTEETINDLIEKGENYTKTANIETHE